MPSEGMRKSPNDGKVRAWGITETLTATSNEGHLFLKVWFFPDRPKLDRLECGRQDVQALLGQFTEQLSATFFCGLSNVGLTGTKGSDSLTGFRNGAQGDGGTTELPFPLDRLKRFQRYVVEESSRKTSRTGVVQPDPAVKSPTGRRNAGPLLKLLPGSVVHVVETDPAPAPAVKQEKEMDEDILLRVLVRNVVAFTKMLGFRRDPVTSFARVQGEPESMMESTSFEDVGSLEIDSNRASDSRLPSVPRFTVRLPNIENLMELVPQIGKAPQSFPDKRKLFSVEDFFKYTEAEGRRLFDELDRDKDGQVTLEDLEAAMRKRRLPQRYAREFLKRTKKHWLKKSFGWGEFLSLMEQKEPIMLRAFNSLSVSKSGTLQKNQVLSLLKNAGLPATEENAAAMMRFLDSDARGSITYGQFRNFLVLLPPERLFDDPRMVWFEAATVVPISPPMEVPSGSVLKSALAGGMACALSTSLLHPLDTLKTRVQASTLSFPELISNIPNIGARGLYRGYAPAILGQFSSHGLRTGIFEASKLLLFKMAPNVSELQVQSLASFCSTLLGTALRIPCEVLKQRLQAGLYDNVGEAIGGTLRKDGWKGFFRGTGATLCREVPFYVAGMMIYEEAKKVVQNVIKRELQPWEVIAIGGLSGGLAAVCTTPFDVMKTRMMTAPPGVPVSMTTITLKIVNDEGLLALFKGAVPRFFWIAPLGAMNFAGYELAKRAMEKKDQEKVTLQ